MNKDTRNIRIGILIILGILLIIAMGIGILKAEQQKHYNLHIHYEIIPMHGIKYKDHKGDGIEKECYDRLRESLKKEN